MHSRGNIPPPYWHPSQLPSPNQMGATSQQDSNPPYPAPTSHSYPTPSTRQPYAQPIPQQIPPPPPGLPFLTQQQFFQSPATPPPNFVPAPPPSQFSPLSTNPSATLPVLIPISPPTTVLPPPPSLPLPPPPPPMPPAPPEVPPKLCAEEVAPDIKRLDMASGPNLEREKAGSVSPALSDMDMEDDDDVLASNKEINESNGEALVKPSSDVFKEPLRRSQSMTKEHIEETVQGSHSGKELGEEADTLVNTYSLKPLPLKPIGAGVDSTPFMKDVSPARSSPGPAECTIDPNSNSKPLEENPNLSPFQLLQQDYGSLDSREDAEDPISDREIASTDMENVKNKGKEIDDSELNEARNRKRLRNKSLCESPSKRIKSSPTSRSPNQPTEVPPFGPHPPPLPSGNPGLISAQDPSEQIWPPLPLHPPPPLAPHMQFAHNPLQPASDFTANLAAPCPPLEPAQTFPLLFPSHAERWPRPSMPVPLSAPLSFASSTSTGAGALTSTLLPSFTGSTISTRYNPYASTFENLPPPPAFSISSNLHGREFSTNYSTKYGSLPTSGPRTVTHPASSNLYDPLSDSIDPIKKSNLLSVPDQLSSKPAAESEADELGEEVVGAVENASPELVAETGPSSTGTGFGLKERTKGELRSLKLLKVALADYVKEVLQPAWRQGNISKDAFKTIVKKTVEKVSSSLPSHQIPKTPSKINQYVEASQQKVTKLVMSYVDKYVKKQL